MISFVADTIHALRTRARYRRRVQEQLLALVESDGPFPISDDTGNWHPLGVAHAKGSELDTHSRTELRNAARELCASNPHAKNLLRLMEIYVVGPALQSRAVAVDSSEADSIDVLLTTANRLWREFLTHNRRHWTYREHARRAWRDGEAFVRLFDSPVWPPDVRFIDPERIETPADESGPGNVTHGIRTEPNDVETPVEYLALEPQTGRLAEAIPAEEVLHTKRDADSNQKRGRSLLVCIIPTLRCFDQWRETELQARKLQASIVLWRKVQGGPSRATALADDAASAIASVSPAGPNTNRRRERYQPGSIITTSQGTQLEFLQPNTNFGDAVPLGRMLLLTLAAGAGVPEFMLTADASNANFASTMVAEGPAVKLFEAEQDFHSEEFTELWRMVMTQAIELGLLPDDFFRHVDLEWSFPGLVNRDRNAERLSNAKLKEAGVLSAAEVARRDGADPERMQRERDAEITSA